MVMVGKSKIKRRPASTNVYMIGAGIGSLAAAVYLIRDAGVPGKNITIFETLDVDGGSLEDRKSTRLNTIHAEGGRIPADG